MNVPLNTSTGDEFGILVRQKKMQRSLPERQTERKNQCLRLPRHTGNPHLKYGKACATTVWKMKSTRTPSLVSPYEKTGDSRFAPNLLPYTGVPAVYFGATCAVVRKVYWTQAKTALGRSLQFVNLDASWTLWAIFHNIIMQFQYQSFKVGGFSHQKLKIFSRASSWTQAKIKQPKKNHWKLQLCVASSFESTKSHTAGFEPATEVPRQNKSNNLGDNFLAISAT